MLLIYEDMSLGGILEENVSLIPLLGRFGIPLGMADKTVGTVCAEHVIDTGFFLTVLNTFLNEDYFPEKKFAAFHVEQIIDYLRKTNQYYRNYQLPNIERHLKGFVASAAGQNPSLMMVANIFSRARNLLLERIERDECSFFPYVSGLCAGHSQISDRQSIRQEDDTQDSGWELLHDIKSVMIRHLTGDYDRNLCYAVLFAVSALERDVKQHDRIRYRILEPAVAAMEKAEKRG